MPRDGWHPAKVRPVESDPVPCLAGDGMIEPGQWQKGKREGNWYQLWHDDCAEKIGAYLDDND